jgi:hypothetical protein
MHIFIDESGSFQVADKTPSPSVVGALIIPDHKLDELLVNYAKLRRKIWPRGGEVKGRQLSELHVAEVIKMLRCHSVLFEAVVVEMGMHTVDGLKAHQASLADGLTRNLTPQHHENTHKGAARLRAELEAMKLPGFVQSTANFQLLREVYTHIPNYFAQRFPRELAQFKWVVDGKEPMVDATPWEKWWSFVTELHGQDHPGPDRLPRLDRRQLGDPVLAPQGLHAGLHHRAGLHGQDRSRSSTSATPS